MVSSDAHATGCTDCKAHGGDVAAGSVETAQCAESHPVAQLSVADDCFISEHPKSPPLFTL